MPVDINVTAPVEFILRSPQSPKFFMLYILADSQSWIYGGKRDDEFDFRPAKFGGHSGRKVHQIIGFESLKFSARIKSVYKFESQQLIMYLP